MSPPARARAAQGDLLRRALTRPLLDSRVRRALEIIMSQPTRSVRELAKDVNSSASHLQRLFKQELGVNVATALGENRVTRGVDLLATSDMPIREIAYALGYQHQSSFARAIRRRLGQSPKHFRRGAE